MKTKTLTPDERATAIKRCEKQVVEVVLSQPFMATLLLHLKRSYDDNIPTMATDGVNLFIGPAFAHGLTDEEIRGVLFHEVLHCVFGHMWRRGERDPKRWNFAADYAENLEIEEYIKGGGKVALPAGCLLDQKYAGMSAEAIYEQLPDNPGGEGGDGQPGGTGDDIMDGAVPEGKTPEEMAADWKGKLVQAAQAARMQGSLPACMDRLVGELINPKVPWRDVLRRFLTDVVQDDYSWTKPNKFFMADDIIVPDIGDREAAGEIVVVVDTSGSIDDAMLTAFFAEINSIHQDLKPTKLHVMYCDAEVHEPIDEFGPSDAVVANPKGGGGTSFVRPFEYIQEHDIRPAALIYLTDLLGSHWNSRPEYPVLWACWSSEENVPFGEVIKVEA
jgi:predicted metal-dependent peptidase